MKVRAPAKLILSGEHAIVYGKPALALAINRYAEVQASFQALPLISFDLGDLAYQQALHFASLDRLKERIKQKYRRFLRGEFKIRHVLRKPVELAQVALSLLFEVLNVKPTQGIKIKVESDIPIGCGMGSSAAIILAVIHVIAHHLGLSLSGDRLFRLALEVEKLQHGYSSGLDLRISQQGGCIYVQDDEIFTRNFPQFPFYLVNTGTPLSSTGECVTQVQALFRQSRIGDDFAAVTQAMDLALQKNDIRNFKQAVHDNHQLLIDIAVVPEKVQHFAHEIVQAGGVAKVCGAGAVRGDHAGVVLVMIDDVTILTDLCARYRYDLIPATAELRGVHVV